jgi:SAM-dependent methyltransferase
METRTPDRIKYHYDVERELADRLKRATKEQRPRLYNEVYNELYSRVPDIPHLDQQSDEDFRTGYVTQLMTFLRPFLAGKQSFLEIGPGDFKLSRAVARHVPKVVAVDVTTEVVNRTTLPPNVTFGLSQGCDIPVPAGSIEIAFSDQVMEHLHPDDAFEQVENIYKALAPNGLYICITPNRLYGPHDVSKYFDAEPRGLHLKEYATHDVVRLFKDVGFSRVCAYTTTAYSACLPVPLFTVISVERSLDLLPRKVRKGLACSTPLRWLLRSRVVGIK